MVLTSSGWGVVVLKSTGEGPSRSAPEPDTSHLARFPADGEDQAQDWRGRCNTVREPQVLWRGRVRDGPLGLADRL